MKWVTRERPKIDRIACPWLITRFIDHKPEFLFVPPAEVLAVARDQDAVPYDVPNVELSHLGEPCSFHTFYTWRDDHEMLKHGLVMYDALYAWYGHARGETHTWNPAAIEAYGGKPRA